MLTILVADDEEPIVELIRCTLEDTHVREVEAFDGLAALRVAAETPPDLALLDVRMPHMDGVEVCRQLRTMPACAQARIVMLTAAGQAEDRARGLAAGADEYLTKPFSPLALLSLVRSSRRSRHGRRRSALPGTHVRAGPQVGLRGCACPRTGTRRGQRSAPARLSAVAAVRRRSQAHVPAPSAGRVPEPPRARQCAR